jgi:hypothetical protein
MFRKSKRKRTGGTRSGSRRSADTRSSCSWFDDGPPAHGGHGSPGTTLGAPNPLGAPRRTDRGESPPSQVRWHVVERSLRPPAGSCSIRPRPAGQRRPVRVDRSGHRTEFRTQASGHLGRVVGSVAAARAAPSVRRGRCPLHQAAQCPREYCRDGAVTRGVVR